MTGSKSLSVTTRKLPAVGVAAFFAFGYLSLDSLQPPPGQPEPNRGIVNAAAWAQRNTSLDTKFLVPPGAGSAFPVLSRRPHVVSFKLVPQLSGELAGWADRLRDVVGVEDLSTFAGGLRGYAVAQERMDDAYADRSIDDLLEVARRQGAEYVVRLGIDHSDDPRIVWRGEAGVTIYRVSLASE